MKSTAKGRKTAGAAKYQFFAVPLAEYQQVVEVVMAAGSFDYVRVAGAIHPATDLPDEPLVYPCHGLGDYSRAVAEEGGVASSPILTAARMTTGWHSLATAGTCEASVLRRALKWIMPAVAEEYTHTLGCGRYLYTIVWNGQHYLGCTDCHRLHLAPLPFEVPTPVVLQNAPVRAVLDLVKDWKRPARLLMRESSSSRYRVGALEISLPDGVLLTASDDEIVFAPDFAGLFSRVEKAKPFPPPSVEIIRDGVKQAAACRKQKDENALLEYSFLTGQWRVVRMSDPESTQAAKAGNVLRLNARYVADVIGKENGWTVLVNRRKLKGRTAVVLFQHEDGRRALVAPIV